MSTKRFHIGDLLTVSTGRLVSPTHVGGLYGILNHLTGDNLMTHQLPLACDAVTPDLLQQHPWLNDITAPDEFDGEADVMAWVSRMAAEYGEWHELEPAPQSWGKHDPIADFTNQYPNTPVIAVEMGDER